MENYMEQFTELVINYAPKVLGAIITLIIGFWIARLIAGKVKNLMVNKNVDPTLIPFLTSLIAIILKILVLFSAASMFGLEVTSFIAIFSALVFAIGLGLQGNLSHMAAGVLLLIFKPFKVKDFIVTNGYSGTVKEIQLINTILTTLDNRIIIIPNGQIMGNPLENITANPMRKVPMTFGISYTDDIDKAREVINQVAKSCDHIDHSQAVDIFVSELGDSSVNFAVRPWVKTEDYWTVYFYMHENIKKEFDKAGIGIPFPQMDVHLHKQN
ncbi:mechanosensitive ion channel family protein [Psychroflexus maritimus]|uniref:Mechanosensitive ion channel n=1 Tax=Psychroflexus maritimus TaxID=2714865 RepID=A0A967AD98_9FLAO|nr:mechanosensitive ion channel domain-containing protein [Psychroflexus maritimus]NGZ89590.1 mechanosensitive ion channel [Psychroflexus maritimus]